MTESDLAAILQDTDPTANHVAQPASDYSLTSKGDHAAGSMIINEAKNDSRPTLLLLPGAWPMTSDEDLSGLFESSSSDVSGLANDQESSQRHHIQELFRPETTNETCGICGDLCNVSDDPMAASRLASTSSTVMPYGIALPCQTRHKYCLECIKQYITTELDRGREGNVVFPIRCPECSWGEWEIPDDTAVKVLEAEHYERWHFQKLFEKTNKYYCPNPHCSTLLDPTDEGETRTKKAQCPLCRKRLCIPCRSLDHEGMSCSKNMRTQRRKGIEGAAVKLARQRGWRRCPKCEVIVERISGCDHMTCKCRHSFCYRCGSDWTYKCSRQWRCKLRLTEGDQIAAEFIQKTKDIIFGPIDDSKSSISRMKQRMIDKHGKETSANKRHLESVCVS